MSRLLPLLWLGLVACDRGGSGGAMHPGTLPGEDGGGEDGGGDGGGDDGGTTDPGPQFDASAKADLRLKRWRQLSLDLQGGLELAEDELCRETGLYDCTTLHVVPLGGISSDNGLYAPQDQISVTTGLAMERLVLQACMNRLAADREAEAPAVFSHLDLAATEATDEEARAQSVELWRRLLFRDPSEEELSGAFALHVDVLEDGGDNGAWAAMLCFALGTSTEALTY